MQINSFQLQFISRAIAVQYIFGMVFACLVGCDDGADFAWL